MRKILFIFPIIFFVTILHFNKANAQYSYSPSNTLIKNQALNTMTYDSIHIVNTSSDTINLAWELLSYDTAGGSFFDFCSSGNCWIGIPATGNFSPIAPGEFGWAGMHFWSGSTPVTCTAKIRLFEQGTLGGDTLTFILNAGTNGIQDKNTMNSILVYPNPTVGMVNVQWMMANGNTSAINHQALTIEIYNSFGQKLRETDSTNSISIKDFDAGSYFVVLKDKTGNRSTRIVQKINH